MNASLRALLVILPALALFACETTKPPLPGERLSVLTLDKQLEPDPEIALLEVRLPRPFVNNDWPEAGGYPNHVMQHVALGDDISTAWRSSIGDGSSRTGRILAPPIAVGDFVYAMDADSTVSAYDRKSGRQVWEANVKPEDAGHAFGGGLAFADDRIFVTTGYAQIVALDAKNGKAIWRQGVIAPLRSAPTVSDGRVFAVTVDNQLEVRAASDGRALWSHSGTPESAGLLGGASPAVEGDVVVAAYSSGELVALRVENGRQLWTDSLASARRTDGGTEAPWVAGDFIYVISNDSELVCLTRRDGRVRWVQELPRYTDLKAKKGALIWSGPILGGDRLIVVASNGEALSLSPYTGAPLGRVKLPDGTYLTPIIANETLFVLTDAADLIAMR